jgi:cell wall-associated NlpC family hydrolase
MPAEVRGVPVMPVILLGAGTYLAWFGVHYWGSDTRWPSDPVKAVLQGKPVPPVTGVQSAAGIAAGVGTGSAGTAPVIGGQTGSAIADDALRYQGEGYVWGGHADTPGDWDCSSFVSYVLSHDLGMKLPGGGKYGDPAYPPNEHGPTTNDYLLFGTPVNLGSEQPGDLVVSTVHMGIVTSRGQMISAQDPQAGTGTGSYLSGFPGGTPFVRRVCWPDRRSGLRPERHR